jgi:hypothetical protein
VREHAERLTIGELGSVGFASSRRFQLWEYQVSHGSLLIRSPRGPGRETNIDLLFDGVELISCPRMLRGLELVEPQPADVTRAAELVGVVRPSQKVFVLVSQGVRALVVAAVCWVDENRHDIFWSPIPWGPVRER